MNRAVIEESVSKSLATKKRNKELGEKSVDACKIINPENPIAAAEVMPEIFKQFAVMVTKLGTDGGWKMKDLDLWLRDAKYTLTQAYAKD